MRVGGLHAHPLHVQSCGARSSWEGWGNPPISTLPLCVLCGYVGHSQCPPTPSPFGCFHLRMYGLRMPNKYTYTVTKKTNTREGKMENEVLISKDDLLDRLYYETRHILRKKCRGKFWCFFLAYPTKCFEAMMITYHTLHNIYKCMTKVQIFIY